MDVILGLFVVAAVLLVIDMAHLAWGVDRRDTWSEHPRLHGRTSRDRVRDAASRLLDPDERRDSSH